MKGVREKTWESAQGKVHMEEQYGSQFDGALVDDGDDGAEGEPGDEVSFGEVAMEKQSF